MNSNKHIDILKTIEEKKPLIESALEKYLPRKFTPEYIEWIFGKPRFEHDIESLQKSLSEPVWNLLDRGGKRWRPFLFLLISELFGTDEEKVKDFTVIPELEHAGSITIDDIEDLGETRRGKPCLHKIFGVDVALNAGNLLYFLPSLVFAKNKDSFSKEYLLRAYEIYSQEMTNIHAGQATDIWWHKGGKHDITEGQYLQMCSYKTGTLARLAARLAAALSGGSPEQEQSLGKLAESIGIAFQIQDDVLSASSESFAERKGFGDDITEGKRSLLVIYTLSKASPEDRSRLLEILDMHTREETLIKEALSLLKKYGSIEYAKNKAAEIVRQTWHEAEPLLPDNPAKEKLKAFARFAYERDS